MEKTSVVFELDGGMKLLCRRAPLVLEYFGVDVNDGSRDETAGRFGLAHFVEHTIFKGTLNRRACHVINRMEAVGGELNAFTTKEETNVYAIAPKGNLDRAVELIADLVINSTFPAAELEREREVVRDEIDSYLDTPSEAVYDDFEDLFYAGSQLGHNILGTDRDLDTFDSAVCRNYLTNNFVAPRMVAYYLGPEEPEKVLRRVKTRFAPLPVSGNAINRVKPAPAASFNLRRNTDSHQSHTVLGAAIPGINAGDREAISLVTNILGGLGMNSRLNVSLRERRGLVYTVEASTTLFSDCGLFNIYFGCDPDDRDRCLDLVFKELTKIADQPLTPRALAAAKKQYLGQLLVSSENLEQIILSGARALLLTGRVRPLDEIRESIEAITPATLQEAAAMLRPELCSVLSLG